MKIRVWDLPTRVFHWALVLCIIGSVVTVNLGGNWMEWHFRFGYAILVLLLFRLTWGFVGSRYARFSSFPPSPRAALAYLRGLPYAAPGHSPLGALSVYALLLALSFQVVTGLFSNDAIMWDGPLRHWVSNEVSDWLTSLHKANRVVLLGLIGLHLSAIAYYAWIKKQALVKAMWTGDQEFDDAQTRVAAHDTAQVRWGGLLVFGIFVAVFMLFITLVSPS
jgi:cytochrome b